MGPKEYTCLLISDFTIDNLSGLLDNDEQVPLVKSSIAPYGQVMSALLDDNHDCWRQKYDFIVVWTQPQAVVKSFDDALSFKKIDMQKLFSEVDDYLAALEKITDKTSSVFIPTWVTPYYNRGYGMLDLNPAFGLGAILMRMNLKLIDFFQTHQSVYVLDSMKWIFQSKKNAFSPKRWYMGKIPFSNDVFSEAIKDLKAGMNGIAGLSKKLIITDLDDTLWGGIVGDDGWEKLNLGGHNAKGEAFVDFQKFLKALTRRGVLLGIVSKNEEHIAMEAIEKHPEMILKKKNFAGWRINWKDKAQNIVELVDELNLGLQSVVFLDDNPVERDRVRAALPEVYVPEMPKDKLLYVQTLQSLRCFDAPSVSAEDLKRAEMYTIERERKELKEKLGSIDDWLKNLNTKITIESIKKTNLERTIQLINKTNQMNLTTRRLTMDEFIEWEQKDDTWLRTFRVSDKFGDAGLTGIISFEKKEDKAQIIDFILSCRVMGRRIEELMVGHAVEQAKEFGITELFAQYIPTKKNKPCLDFWKSSGFETDDDETLFKWRTSKEYPVHDFVELEVIS